VTLVLDLAAPDLAIELELLFAAGAAPEIVWRWVGSEFEEPLGARWRLRSLFDQMPDTHAVDFNWADRRPAAPWAQAGNGPAGTRIVEVGRLGWPMPMAVYLTGDPRAGVVTLPAAWSTTDYVCAPERAPLSIEAAVTVTWQWMRDGSLADGFDLDPAVPGPWRRSN
jgi:hypothetical protein